MAPELEWIAAVVGSPNGPAVLAWYEPATDLVVDIRVTDAVFTGAADLFEQATVDPKAGAPRRPRRVRVADERLADQLRGVPGLDVIVGDISDAREMLESLGAYVAEMTLEPEVPPETWGRLFAAAAALYRARPWDAIPSDAWIEVDCERLGITGGALTVVGQQGESYGFMLCRSVEDAALWLDAGMRREHGEPATFPNQFFMLGYNDRDEMDPEDIAEINRLRWELASDDAYPSLTVLDAAATGRLPTSDEIEGITAIMEGLVAMLHDEPEIADAWHGDAMEWQADGGGVRFAVPLDVAEPPDDADILGDVLIEFADVYHAATFQTITAPQLEALLLETIPAQLAVESDEAPYILAATRALLADRPLVTMLDAAFEKRLVRALEDESKFTPGKQLVMAGIAAGYDMSSEEGVEEFVQTFAREALTRTGKPKRKAKATAKPKAKAKAKARPRPTPKAKAKAKAKAKPKARPSAKKRR